MKLGYARTSTTNQKYSIEAQEEILKAHDVDMIFKEQVSAVDDRPEFERLLDFARKGDSIVVTKLDRAFRSVRHMGEVVGALENKGVILIILDMNLDTSTATGRLILNVMTSVAQFEREIMKERQAEGIKRAKSEGKYKGRKKKIVNTENIITMIQSGVSKSEVCAALNISRTTLFRYLKELELKGFAK